MNRTCFEDSIIEIVLLRWEGPVFCVPPPPPSPAPSLPRRQTEVAPGKRRMGVCYFFDLLGLKNSESESFHIDSRSQTFLLQQKPVAAITSGITLQET